MTTDQIRWNNEIQSTLHAISLWNTAKLAHVIINILHTIYVWSLVEIKSFYRYDHHN